ncbi:MAG TPA: VCBS repeat-containing protein, partial [Gemmatimonadales bacterium]|nr:VCBS repeat-containing protein [Gemmatimonadales bacterium]
MKKRRLFLFATALTLSSCERGAAPVPRLFESVAPEASGVTFANTLPEDSAVNIVSYLYYYNGGGVAAGDIDGDGLLDLYFTSNLGRNRLYRNLGHFRFEDITDRAGVADSEGWKSGVTMADVNGDGRLDIYVSGVNYLGMQG